MRKVEPMPLIRRLLVAIMVVVALFGLAVDTSYAQTDATVEVARVGDVVVTLGDVDTAWNENDAASQLRMLQQLYDARRRVLDFVIGNHLIDQEATARGVSRDELLAEEIPSRTLPITDDEVEGVYERSREALGGRTLEDVRVEIEAAIERQRPTQALQQFMDDLRGESDDVVLALDPPRQRVEILPNDPTRGPVDAPILLVEFSDFQCPFCQRATGTLAKLVERYENQIQVVYKDYPLAVHPDAFKAAEAGNCAHDQGMFWELHDKMFASQDALDVPSLVVYASELGLDAAAFSTCLDEGRYTQRVQHDLQLGQLFGVSSTPTVFINGRPVMGAAPIETFEQIILEELATAGR
jgi:protein-disulfide isomerase